jgi:hypothetical protein
VHVQLVKKKEKKRECRAKNAYFKFCKMHPLHKLYVQRTRSKLFVPVLAGGPPPSLYFFTSSEKNKFSSASDSTKNELRYAARYYTTLLSPWILQRDVGLVRPGELLPESGTSWDSFTSFIEHLNTKFKCADGWQRKSFLSSCLLKYIGNVSSNLKIEKEEKILNMKFRSRIATKWTDSNIGICDINAYVQKKLFGFKDPLEAEKYSPDAYMVEGLHEQDDLEAIRRIEALASVDPKGPISKGELEAREYLDRAKRSVQDLFGFSSSCHDPIIGSNRSQEEDISSGDCLYTGDTVELRRIKLLLLDIRKGGVKLKPLHPLLPEEAYPGGNGLSNPLTRPLAINSIDRAIQNTDYRELQDHSGFCYRSIMSDTQIILVERVANHIDAMEAYMSDSQKYPMPAQLLDLALGGPGSGKTWLANVLITLANTRGRGEICQACSFTAKAAILMKGGLTIQQVGLILTENKNGTKNNLFNPLRYDSNITKLKEQLNKIEYLILDEVSMAFAVILGQLDDRFRQGDLVG